MIKHDKTPPMVDSYIPSSSRKNCKQNTQFIPPIIGGSYLLPK